MSNLQFFPGNRHINNGSAHGSGEPPDNGDMELIERVGNLETDMKDVRERLVRIESAMVTKEEIKTMQAESRSSIADLKAEMHKQHIDIQRWMIATVIGLFLGFGGLFLAMSNALKASSTPAASTAPQQSAPIVITLPGQAALQQPTK